MVRGRGYARSLEDFENIVVGGERQRLADPGQGRRRGRLRPGHPARRHRPRRPGRGRFRDRRHAPGPERPRRHQPGQGQDQGDRAGHAGGRQGRPRLRPLRAHPPLHRHAEVDPHRGHRHRHPGHHALPLARAERPHPRRSPSPSPSSSPSSPSGCWASPPTSCRSAGSPSPSGRSSTRRSSSSSRPTRSSRNGSGTAARRTTGGSSSGPSRRSAARASSPCSSSAASFLPVLTLEAEEGRLFRPLAYTKTLAMVVAAFLAITLDPALRLAVTHFRNFRFRPQLAVPGGERRPRRDDPAGGKAPDQPLPDPALRAGGAVDAAPAEGGHRRGGPGPRPRHRARLLQARLGVHAAPRRGVALLHADDHARDLHRGGPEARSRSPTASSSGFPEVERVLGKAGRAETSTDPAPLSMLETVITLKPKSEWRRMRDLVLVLGAGVAEAPSSGTSPRTTSPARNSSPR